MGACAWVKGLLWPGGKWPQERAPDWTPEEKLEMKLDVRQNLDTIIPVAAQALIGRDACSHGCRDVFEFLNCKLLLKNLAYTLLDMLLLRLFPDINVEGMHHVRRPAK